MSLKTAKMSIRSQIAIEFRAQARAFSSTRLRTRPGRLDIKAMSQENAQFKEASNYIADTFLQSGQSIGLGTGAPIAALLDEIAQRMNAGTLSNIKCVPSSDVSASEAAFHGIPVISPMPSSIDVFIDCADELDSKDGNLPYIIGRGENGPQGGHAGIAKSKKLASIAARCVVIADDVTSRLTGDLPVEVEMEEWEETGEELDDIFLGDAEIKRRSFDPNAGPRGGDNPVITADDCFILDVQFYGALKLFGEEASYYSIKDEIENTPGVVCHGLMLNVAEVAVLVSPDGKINVVESDSYAKKKSNA